MLTLKNQACFCDTCSQASASMLTVSQRNTGVTLIIPSLCSQALYTMIYNSTVTHLLRTKCVASQHHLASLNRAFSEPVWWWCWRIYSLRGVGTYRKSKRRGGGDWRELVWGYGDGQLSSNPQGTACYAKQNQSFSKKLGLICQPQQTLPVSHLSAPSTHLIGVFLFIHRKMETTLQSLHLYASGRPLFCLTATCQLKQFKRIIN